MSLPHHRTPPSGLCNLDPRLSSFLPRSSPPSLPPLHLSLIQFPPLLSLCFSWLIFTTRPIFHSFFPFTAAHAGGVACMDRSWRDGRPAPEQPLHKLQLVCLTVGLWFAVDVSSKRFDYQKLHRKSAAASWIGVFMHKKLCSILRLATTFPAKR